MRGRLVVTLIRREASDVVHRHRCAAERPSNWVWGPTATQPATVACGVASYHVGRILPPRHTHSTAVPAPPPTKLRPDAPLQTTWGQRKVAITCVRPNAPQRRHRAAGCWGRSRHNATRGARCHQSGACHPPGAGRDAALKQACHAAVRGLRWGSSCGCGGHRYVCLVPGRAQQAWGASVWDRRTAGCPLLYYY